MFNKPECEPIMCVVEHVCDAEIARIAVTDNLTAVMVFAAKHDCTMEQAQSCVNQLKVYNKRS